MPSEELIEKAAKAIADACGMPYGEAMRSDAWRFMVRDAEACLAVFEQAQPNRDAAVLEQAADEVDLSAHYPEQLSEYHNAEAAVEAWLRARAAQIREGKTE